MGSLLCVLAQAGFRQPPRCCLSCYFQLSVDTLQFLLFLYIQQLNRVSLRASLIGEGWPNRTRSPSPSDREAKTSMQNKVQVPGNVSFNYLLMFLWKFSAITDRLFPRFCRTGTIRPTLYLFRVI